MKFITNASVVRHILLANVIYGDEIQRKVDQASHMSPLQGHSLIVCTGPGSNLGLDKKFLTCVLLDEEYEQVCTHIYQQLYLLIKSIFVSKKFERK